MNYDYIYLDKTRTIEGQEHYEVIRVKILNDDRWTAELKARRFAKNNKLGKLAGGCFTDSCKPYNFKSNYKVYNCPVDYKPAKESKHDKFIADLIETESNTGYVLF